MNLSPEELKEVLSIFKAEAIDQIKILNNGLLELEKNPKNKGNVEEIFRTAHSIKGSSRMLGLEPIELISHELEDLLGQTKSGRFGAEKHIDLMYESVDKIDGIIKILSQSEKPDLSKIDVSDLVHRLKALQDKNEDGASEKIVEKKETPKKRRSKKAPKVEAISDEKIVEKQEQISSVDQDMIDVEKELETKLSEKTGQDASDREEFLRIPIHQIDRIMNLVAELVTTKIKNEKDIQKLFELQTKTSSLHKEFENLHGLIESLHQLYNKATESVSLDHLNENEVRALLRLLITSSTIISPLQSGLTNMIQDKVSDNVRNSNLIDLIQEEVRDTRLLPLTTLLDLMPRMVRDISKHMNKKVELHIEGGDTKLDKQILEEMKNPIIHIIRNCIDHGIEDPDERVVNGKPATGRIDVIAKYEGNSVFIEIRDDGNGIDEQKVLEKAVEKRLIQGDKASQLSKQEVLNLIFSPGFSTSEIITDISGRGVGMDVVRTNVEKLKGVISIESKKGKGSSFQIRLPLTLATIQVLIVESCSEQYTIPVISIDRLMQIKRSDVQSLNNKNYITVDEQLISIAKLDEILEKPRRFKFDDEKEIIEDEPQSEVKSDIMPVVLCHSADRKVALIVDRLIDEQDVVIKELGRQFKRVRNVMGTTILGNGELAIILDPSDLVKSSYSESSHLEHFDEEEQSLAKKRVLVVDDSITTRTLEKNILEQAGYDVTISVNGRDAWKLLGKQNDFDIVVSDVEMPYMTGFDLVEHIKKSDEHKHLPCILCTSLESDKDKRRGVEVGANAYITKGSFNQRTLLETIERLI